VKGAGTLLLFSTRKGARKMIFTCEEHIDIAIDEYVDETEQAPDIEPVDNNEQQCRFCEKTAVYVVGK
jgi:CxxH/CxxC protein (TIGR04129 family)